MTVLSVNPPFPTFQGTDGYPLENGNIYVGQANMNPLANPVAAFWDAAMTQPAGLPIKTTGGYPSNNGTPSRIYVNGDCSIVVIDKKGVTVYSSPSVTDRYNGSVVSIDANSVSFTQSGTGAVTTTVQNKLTQLVSILDFGADKTGVMDSTTAIQNALNSGAKRIYAPSGTYKITATLTMPKNVSLEGDGIDLTIFDGSTSSYSSLIGGKHITNAVGTFTQISGLASNVAAGDATLTFSNSVALAPNDIILIYNPTDYSYSHARTYYRAGEYARIAVASGTSATVQGTLAAGYTAASVNVYKLENSGRCKLSGFTLKGLNSTTSSVYGIFLNTCVDSTIENVRVHNCSYTSIIVDRCFNMQVVGCSVQEDMVSSFGGDYGLSISSCQNVNVSGGYFCAGRHAITTGSFDGIGYVPNRYVYVNDATITTTYNALADAPAMDFHENTEYANVIGCTLNGGITVGGNYINISNNFLEYGSASTPSPFYCTSLSGANLSVDGNTIISKTNTFSSDVGLLMQIVLVDDRIETGGTISIKNNKLIWNGGSVNSRNLISIYTAKKASSGIVVNLDISGNTFSSSSSVDQAISVSKADDTTMAFKDVVIKNNVSNCGGIAVKTSAVLVNTYMVENLSIQTNDVSGGKQQGIIVYAAKVHALIKGNRVSNFNSYGIGISNNGLAQKVVNAEISQNVVTNCLSTPTGSAVTNSGAYMGFATAGVIKDNFCSNNKKYIVVVPVLGTIAAGDVLTGGTSGVTATVDAVDGTKIGIGTSASGNFSLGETVTASPSGATATIATSNTFAVDYSVGIESTQYAYVARNVDYRSLDPKRSSITSYMKGSEWDIPATAFPGGTPITINNGNGQNVDLSVDGTSIGDIVMPSFSANLQGIILTGYVKAANTPTFRFQNQTGGNLTINGNMLGKIIKV